MLLSEANHNWRPLPRWSDALIRLGHGWKLKPDTRQIALVSMPCDSSGAELIALGALIRDLGDPAANDIDAHYLALQRFADQYLKSCRDCDIRCDPLSKKCGYFEQASGVVQHKDGNRYRIADISRQASCGDVIRCSNNDETRWVLPAYAADWRIDGQPAVKQESDTAALVGETYERFACSSAPRPENLHRSFSGLCLAGRAQGESSTREAAGSIRFRIENVDYNLADLLTIDGWSPSRTVSRMSFFNSRTEQFDRYGCSPS